MEGFGVQLLDARHLGILRYEALQEVERSIRIDTPAVRVEVRDFDFDDPSVKALVERIKFAKLSWDKKEQLLKLLFMYLKSGESGSAAAMPQPDFVKKMYQLIQMMELTQEYRLGPEELEQHKRNADQMCTDFLIEEERSRRLKEGRQGAGYSSMLHPSLVQAVTEGNHT